MSARFIQPTAEEITFDEEEIIVSKTDIHGVITYANDVFTRVCGYSEEELLGQPHNIVRHPDMPRCVFRLLWGTIKSGQEIFAYVKNLAKNGAFYWVHAHITPSFDRQGNIAGYHSNRRVPYSDALVKVIPLYAELLAEERRHADPRDAIAASSRMLDATLARSGMDYGQFVFSLSEFTRLETSV